MKPPAIHDDGRTVARNAAVGELKVIASFGAAADQERALGHTHEAACTVWGNYFQHSFRDDGYGIRHKTCVSADCSMLNAEESSRSGARS